jgi:hypothetical protein
MYRIALHIGAADGIDIIEAAISPAASIALVNILVPGLSRG